MTTTTAHPAAHRADVGELLERLARLQAASVTLRNAAADLRRQDAPDTLLAVLTALERDLLIASRESARVRQALQL